MAIKSDAELSTDLTTNFTDGGANTAAEFRTFEQDIIDSKKNVADSISSLTEENNIDEDADSVGFYDNSAGAERRALLRVIRALSGYKNAVHYATAAALPSNTYANGTAGVGATLTATANGTLAVDGINQTVGNRVLVKNQASGLQNGIYSVTQSGNGGAPYILTRSTDFDTAARIKPGSDVRVLLGDTNIGKQFYMSSPTVAPTVGTTALVFAETVATLSQIEDELNIVADVEINLEILNGLGNGIFLKFAGDEIAAAVALGLRISKHLYGTEVDNGNSSTADTITWATSNFQKSTLTGNCTFTFTAPNGPTTLILKLTQDGTGSRTVTWPAAVKWSGGTPPTLTTTAGRTDIISFYYDGTYYIGTSTLNFTL